MQERVAAERERRRKESSAGLELPNFEVDERTCEPFKEIFEAAPEFLAK